MRSLQECQAEVFRRGERKIKQRRRRRAGLILACVPLAVCLLLLPKNSKAEKGLQDEQLAGNGISVVQVQIGDRVLTNQEDIRQFMTLMEGYSVQQSIADSGIGAIEPEAAPEDCEPPTENLDINKDADAYHAADRYMAHETNKGHTITLMLSDGTQTTYFLSENRLTDLKTGQVTVLSDGQAQRLRDLIKEMEE